MIEERQRLQECPLLHCLLRHYAELGRVDRTIWQDRLMELEGAESPALVKLHGELLAYEWIEMNVGYSSGGKAGGNIYRVTLDGLRALGQFQASPEDEAATTAPRRDFRPKRQRPPAKRKQVSQPQEAHPTEVADTTNEAAVPLATGEAAEPAALDAVLS